MKHFAFVAFVLMPCLAFGAGRKNLCKDLLTSEAQEVPFEFDIVKDKSRTEIRIVGPHPEEGGRVILAEADFIKLGSSIFDFHFDRGAGAMGRQDFTDPILNRLFFEYPGINQIRTTLLGDDLEGFLPALSKNQPPSEALKQIPLARALWRRGFKQIDVVKFYTDDDDPMGTLHVDVAFKK